MEKKRKLIAVKAVTMALEELLELPSPIRRDALVSLARQYGGSWKLTEREIDAVLGETLNETFGVFA